MVIKRNGKSENGIIIEFTPKSDSTVGTSARRPMRRLKLIPPREPSPSDVAAGTDSTLNTPLLSPVGLRAPPCSPSRNDQGDGGYLFSARKSPEIPEEIEEIEVEREVIKGSISPVPAEELFEPEHRPPTPPYYVQHFEEAGFNPYEGDNKLLTAADRNANTYVRKASFPRSGKRQKNKGVWAFKDSEDYPRGETPTLEMILGPEDDLNTHIAKKVETETESEEDEEVSRDPGIPVTLTVGIDDSGRFHCRWGTCDKSFARNDHLGRHVRVSHLRVRSASTSFSSSYGINLILFHSEHRCEPCGMAFIGVKGLRNHEKTHNLRESTSGTVVSSDETPVRGVDDEVDLPLNKTASPITSSAPTAYMFELDGEEET